MDVGEGAALPGECPTGFSLRWPAVNKWMLTVRFLFVSQWGDGKGVLGPVRELRTHSGAGPLGERLQLKP